MNSTASLLLLCSFCCIFSACDEEKPYTPFQVATSLPGASTSPLPPTQGPQPPGIDARPVVSLNAPDRSSTWSAFDRKITAPADNHVQVAMEVPGRVTKEVLAWFLPAAETSLATNSGLWLVDQNGRPSAKLLSLPETLPRGNNCRFRATLKQSGPGSLVSRLRSECSGRLLPGTPLESLTVLAPTRDEPVLIQLSVQDTAPGETMVIEVDSIDRDSDGLDDVELQVSLTSPSGKQESLPLRWLSRTAGASREANSPQKELLARAERLRTAAVRKKERGDVPGQADALRRLLAAICTQGAVQKLSLDGKSGIDCGQLGPALAKLSDAVILAELGEGHYELALGEAERSDWFFEKRDARGRRELATLLEQKIPGRKTERLALFKVKAQTLPGFHFSPLHFDESGQLWLLAAAGTTKRLTMAGDPPLVIPATEDAPERRIEAPSWSLDPVGPQGETLTAALPSCDRSEVQLVFTDKNGTAGVPVPQPILAPRPGSCKNLSSFSMSVVPIAQKNGPLTAVIGGQLVSAEGHLRPLSSAVAWGTSFGLAFKTKDRFELLTGDEGQKLSHCVVSPSEEKIACLGPAGIHVLSGLPR